MKLILCLLICFHALRTRAETVHLNANDMSELPSPLSILSHPNIPSAASKFTKRNLKIHQSILSHEAYRKIDPYLSKESSGYHLSRTWTTSNDFTLRIVPHVDGIPVHGGDRVFSVRSGEWISGKINNPKLKRRSNKAPSPDISKRGLSDSDESTESSSYPSSWILSKRDAIEFARQHSTHLMSSAINTKQIEKSDFHLASFAEKVYFTLDNHELAPAWKVVDSHQMIKDRHMRFIDAENGRLLASYPLVCHDQAHVFQTSQYKVGAKPSIQSLPNVEPNNTLNGGKGIVGSVFRSFNACKYYKCLPEANGTIAPNGLCDMDHTACLEEAEIKDLKEGQDYFTVQSWFVTNGKYIDFDRDWNADGYENGVIHMVWEKAPVFAPRISPPVTNTASSDETIWGADIDFSKYSDKDQTDAFAELQAYYSLNQHHKFMSGLFNVTTDTGICLVGTGVNCTEKDPRTNQTATKYTMPLRFVSNLPDIGPPGINNGYPPLLDQIKMGLGKNMSNPVVFPSWKGFPNAFFANGAYKPSFPDNETDPFNCANYRPGNNSAPSCLSIFDAQFTYFGFGHDEREGDWSLNDCVVYHELVHAYVAKLAPTLAQFIWNPKNGISSDPGAMNEGWSDYFASIHCGIENYSKDTYNGKPFRNILNDFTCEKNVGQVHYDGIIFAGGLWKVRKAIPNMENLSSANQREYDQLILQALSMATSTETFESQYRHVLDLLKNHNTLSTVYPVAKREFEKRVFNCTRITPYTEKLDTTFFLPHALTTSKNVSVLPNQFKLTPRASDWGMSLSWDQFYSSPILGNVQMGYAKTIFKALTSFDCPIAYKETEFKDNPSILDTGSFANGVLITGTNTTLQGVRDCQEGQSSDTDTTITWEPVSFDNATFRGKLDFRFSPGSVQNIYVMPSHQVPATLVMAKTMVVFYGMHQIWRFTMVVLGCLMTLNFFFSMLYIFILFVIRLFKKSKCKGKQIEDNQKEESIHSQEDADQKNSLKEKPPSVPGKPRFLVNKPKKFWTYSLLTTIFYGGSAGSSIVAIAYGPARDIGLIVSLGVFCLAIFIDFIRLVPWKSDQVISRVSLSESEQAKRKYWRKWLIRSTFASFLSLLIAFILVFFANAPLAIHAVVYSIFMISFSIKLIAFFNFYSL